MTTLDPYALGTTLFSGFIKNSSYVQFAAMIAGLAESGQINIIEAAYEHNMIPPLGENARTFVSYAVLPLVSNVSPDDTARAEAIVEKWTQRYRKVTANGLDELLREWRAPSVLHHCVLHGGASVFDASNAPLWLSSRITGEKDLEPVTALLSACIKIGHRRPLEAAITGCLKGIALYYEELAAELDNDHAAGMISDTVRDAVVKRVISSADWLQNPEFRGEKVHAIATFAQLLHLVRPTIEQWNELLATWQKRPRFMTTLAESHTHSGITSRFIVAAVDAGLSPDDFHASVPGKRDPAPLLYAAASADNLGLVQSLVAIGVDPAQTAKVGGKQKSAGELAAAGSETQNYLNALRARNAMKNVSAMVKPASLT
jgi:hypothetical protein